MRNLAWIYSLHKFTIFSFIKTKNQKKGSNSSSSSSSSNSSSNENSESEEEKHEKTKKEYDGPYCMFKMKKGNIKYGKREMLIKLIKVS